MDKLLNDNKKNTELTKEEINSLYENLFSGAGELESGARFIVDNYRNVNKDIELIEDSKLKYTVANKYINKVSFSNYTDVVVEAVKESDDIEEEVSTKIKQYDNLTSSDLYFLSLITHADELELWKLDTDGYFLDDKGKYVSYSQKLESNISVKDALQIDRLHSIKDVVDKAIAEKRNISNNSNESNNQK